MRFATLRRSVMQRQRFCEASRNEARFVRPPISAEPVPTHLDFSSAAQSNEPMKILHTADWHLGDRLGYIDRTEDIRRAVERVAEYSLQHQVEVLIVAGDLFSEQSRADGLRDSLGHLQRTFHPFLAGGGTIVALAGNHDSDTFCQTLHHAMSLAAPPGRPGELMPRGRLYLGTSPTFFRLADAAGQQVQFVLMPYPTRSRYLKNGEA